MKPTLTSEVLHRLFDISKLSLLYQGDSDSAESGEKKLEVERLFYLGKGSTATFIQKIQRLFKVARNIKQIEEFWDDAERRLTAIDAYFRLRAERGESGFLEGEAKAAHPGAATNRNVRPAVDEKCSEQELQRFRAICKELGMSVVREIEKDRTQCFSIEEFCGCKVELEVDHFLKAGKYLVGHSFVSFSVEAADADRGRADTALDAAIDAVGQLVRLIDCRGNNYESYFDGSATIPTP